MGKAPLAAALAALLLAAGTVSVQANPAALVLIGTSMVASLFSDPGCGGLFGGAETCKCRNIYLVVQSGSRDGVETGPYLNLTRTEFEGGQQCQISSPTLLKPGTRGGVQVGNTGRTYMTGTEAYITYAVLGGDGKQKLDCSIKFWVNNPYWGSNGYSASINGGECPPNLKVALGQYISGDRDAAVEYFVFLDKDKDGRPDRRLQSDRRMLAAE